MDVISSNAPYYITVATRDYGGNVRGEYKIYIGYLATESNLVYTGKLYPKESSGTTLESVNLQPILVNYTPETIGIIDDIGNYFNPEYVLYSTSRIFTVVYDTTAPATTETKQLFMIYCTENATNEELGWDSSTSAFPYIANDYIQDKYIAGTYFSLLQLTPDEGDMVVIYLREIADDGTAYNTYWDFETANGRRGGILPLHENTVSFSIDIAGVTVVSNMKVIRCLPANSYILYYVNPLGAIDYIICDKNNSVTYNADRHSMTRYADISDRTKFGKINYLNNTSRTWTLNTDIMDDEASKQMYKVFYSEYMWLYDIDKDEWHSVVLDDAKLKIKKFQTDKVYNYTIVVKSSQTFTIQ